MFLQDLDCKLIESKLGYKFINKKYLLNALTHSSYANETKGKRESNERLEFLGDSVLGIIVSDYIFSHCPSYSEGELTRLRSSLVCEKALCEFSKALNFNDFLIMSRGEKNSGGNNLPSILADAFEAVTAAIYLDGGLQGAKEFVLKFVVPIIRKPSFKKFDDYKTNLQEVVQKVSEEKLIYKITNYEGPDHNKTFWAEVSFCKEVVGKGTGKTKKAAEQDAAKSALQFLKNKNRKNKKR